MLHMVRYPYSVLEHCQTWNECMGKEGRKRGGSRMVQEYWFYFTKKWLLLDMIMSILCAHLQPSLNSYSILTQRIDVASRTRETLSTQLQGQSPMQPAPPTILQRRRAFGWTMQPASPKMGSPIAVYVVFTVCLSLTTGFTPSPPGNPYANLNGQPCDPPFGYTRRNCGGSVLLSTTSEPAPRYKYG